MNGHKQVAEVMKALAHPVRLQILEALAEEREACVCHLELRLDQRQAYISQQLAKLRAVGLVSDRRDGLNVYYAIIDKGIEDLIRDARGLAIAIARREGEELNFEPLRPIGAEICGCPRCEQVAVPS